MRTPFAGIPILVAACQDDPRISSDSVTDTLSDHAATATLADDTNLVADVGTQALPPLVQGLSDADITITSAIAYYLTLDRHQSAAVKDITIITRDGTVTLRGLLTSSDERARIIAAADLMAGAGHVIDELTVIPS